MAAGSGLDKPIQQLDLGLHPENQFRVGDVSVEVRATHAADVALSVPLKAFHSKSSNPDIRIEIMRVSQLADTGNCRIFDSGSVWRLHEHDADLQFDFSTPRMGNGPYKRLIVDHEFRSGWLQISESLFHGSPDSPAPLDYPLDELLIMHRLTQEKAIELHGTGIVRENGEANLFVGHSGAGKSTTTRLWTDAEVVEVLSDDRIIVRHDRSSSTTMRMYGTPWHGEAMFASPSSAPLTRIFVLEHGHGNAITPLLPSQAVAELFARSFVPFHRHEYVDSALVFLEELANAVPVYRYAFEPDQRAVEKIRNFHD